MSPHGNPEVPASAATEINREAPKASPVVETASVPTDSPAPVETKPVETQPTGRTGWGLWEVFVRSSRGLSHVHAGSLHAPDAAMALRNARDLYTRRNEGVSIWVVPADAIAASDPDSKGSFFESPQGKDYRHATYYTKSEGVKHL
ncbi:1,2-phenylacetyl-CoA epoxidase subunit PaaB [Pseudarthrobacter raffinosi]|uniref:1,2-phenylacetyl-CoA epoxidase subunit PaaB n=1 Tax=Pseudarthrobacter raffinosi TaxID=2953651 RepID=UPI00208FAD56|nr:1,2-phenylacetyl-CoA epoxidase subunit PaaB [Pseudarthrobacter sp. MDT3-9]MCO4252095.1 1,2-phenylacetyl-CoA epoxidase subunit B [Pseudarthrobacter sp. MDT3-9]